MRPSRLSQIVDAAGNTTFALDQQNITGSKGVAQGRRIVRSQRLTVVGRLLQPGNQTSAITDHRAHRLDPHLAGAPVWQFQIALLPFGYPSYIPSVIMRDGPDHCTEV